jgi:hypothetical protein
VTSVDAKKTLGTGLLRGWAGDTVPDFNGVFADLFFYEVPFDDECLSDMVEIEILVEFVCGQDLADYVLARDNVATAFVVAVETPPGLGAKALGPVRNSPVSTHPTEDCPGCDGQNRYKWMTSTPRPVPTASK